MFMHACTLTHLNTQASLLKTGENREHCKRQEVVMQHFYASIAFTEESTSRDWDGKVKEFKSSLCMNVHSQLICLHKCVSASCIYLGILRHLSPPWPQRSCVNTRPQHALSHQSARQGGRGIVPVHVPGYEQRRGAGVRRDLERGKEEQKRGQTFI